jgi:hypothetical protein
MLWMLGLHHWLVLECFECFELFLPWLVYDWIDFNLLECFINYTSFFFFFLACVCCDLFICEKVKDLFDKNFIEVGESD